MDPLCNKKYAIKILKDYDPLHIYIYVYLYVSVRILNHIKLPINAQIKPLEMPKEILIPFKIYCDAVVTDIVFF